METELFRQGRGYEERHSGKADLTISFYIRDFSIQSSGDRDTQILLSGVGSETRNTEG